MKHEPSAKNGSTFFDAFLNRLINPDDHLEWQFFADPMVELRPGLPMLGENKTRVQIHRGPIDLTPFAGCDVPALLAALETIAPYQQHGSSAQCGLLP